jgi:hypothetical protein
MVDGYFNTKCRPLMLKLKVRLSLCLMKHHAFLNSALDEASCLGRFKSQGERVPLHLDGRVGGPLRRSERGGEDEKIPFLPIPRIETRSSSTEPSHYTVWAAHAPREAETGHLFCLPSWPEDTYMRGS